MEIIAGALFEFIEDGYRFWSGLGDIELEGKEYRGVGNLASISAAEEGVDIPDDRLVVTLQVSEIEKALRIIDQADETSDLIYEGIWTRQGVGQASESEIGGAPPGRSPPRNEWRVFNTSAREAFITTGSQFKNINRLQLAWNQDFADKIGIGDEYIRDDFTLSLYNIAGSDYYVVITVDAVNSFATDQRLTLILKSPIKTNIPNNVAVPGLAASASDFTDTTNQIKDNTPISVYIGDITTFPNNTLPAPAPSLINFRKYLLEDPGLQTCQVNWILSDDGGRTWVKTALQFLGRLSNPTFNGAVYTFELEQYKGTGHNPVIWSDEFQKKLYPDDDGLKYMRTFGQPFQIRWPPTF